MGSSRCSWSSIGARAPDLGVEARPAGTQGDAGWLRAGVAGSFSRGGPRDTVRADVTPLLARLDAQSSRKDLEWRVRFASGRATKDGRERFITTKPVGPLSIDSLSLARMIPTSRA